MKIVKRIIWIICLAWIGYIGYQYFNKAETAKTLLEQKVDELSYVGFDILLQKLEKGYESRKIEVNEKDYWMGWVVVRPDAVPRFNAFHIGKPHLEIPPAMATRTEEISEIKVCIYVDYIDIVPFGYLKTGFSHILSRKVID